MIWNIPLLGQLMSNKFSFLFFKYVQKNENSGGNPGVNYHFLVLGQPSNSSAYKWVAGDWSTCSRSCAVGKSEHIHI